MLSSLLLMTLLLLLPGLLLLSKVLALAFLLRLLLLLLRLLTPSSDASVLGCCKVPTEVLRLLCPLRCVSAGDSVLLRALVCMPC
jgi:hypothetical protein